MARPLGSVIGHGNIQRLDVFTICNFDFGRSCATGQEVGGEGGIVLILACIQQCGNSNLICTVSLAGGIANNTLCILHADLGDIAVGRGEGSALIDCCIVLVGSVLIIFRCHGLAAVIALAICIFVITICSSLTDSCAAAAGHSDSMLCVFCGAIIRSGFCFRVITGSCFNCDLTCVNCIINSFTIDIRSINHFNRYFCIASFSIILDLKLQIQDFAIVGCVCHGRILKQEFIAAVIGPGETFFHRLGKFNFFQASGVIFYSKLQSAKTGIIRDCYIYGHFITRLTGCC